MSSAQSRPAIRPERCDRCGACVVACPRSLVKVGGGYIYIDIGECDSCFACVEACKRGAIERGARSSRAASGTATGAKVVVGSRAEAKAYKQAAKAAEKTAAQPAKRPAGAAAGAHAGTAARSLSVRVGAPIGGGAGGGVPADVARHRPGMSWLPQEVGALFAVMLAAFALKQVALASMVFELMPPAGQVVARSLILAAYYGVQIAVVAFLVHRRGHTVASAFDLQGSGSTVSTRLANASLIIVLLLGTRAFSTGWGALMRGLGWTPPVVAGSDFSALFGAGVGGLALTLLAVAVVGPIAEELFFRGAALRVLAERIGPWPAIFVTGLLYAGSHLEPWIFVSTFVLGIALGWLAWIRGSLRSAIVLHGLYNATAVIAAYYVAS